MHRVLVAAAVGVAAVTLQGCGSKHGHGDDGIPTTLTTTTTGTPSVLPPQEPLPFRPLRGVVYQAFPKNAVVHPGYDMTQEGYKMQWGKEGRDDLGMLRTMGANTVWLDHALGAEWTTDHREFLDRAEELGLHLIVGFHMPNVCKGFDCFQTWRRMASDSLKAGFLKDGKWHPAVKVINLMDSPDILDSILENTTTELVSAKCDSTEAVCRVRAALSAMDGLLKAEEDAKVVNASDVMLTISWSWAAKQSIDGKVGDDTVGPFGFQDMMVGTADPSVAQYTARAATDLKAAFDARWIHSVKAPAAWTNIKEWIADRYEPYKGRPWMVSEYTNMDEGISKVAEDLAHFDAEASREGSPFFGAVAKGFAIDYTSEPPSDQGFFGLGDATLGTVQPCEEDTRTLVKNCPAEYDVNCLDPKQGKYADEVAAAWGGVAWAHGSCAGGGDSAAPESQAQAVEMEADVAELVV